MKQQLNSHKTQIPDTELKIISAVPLTTEEQEMAATKGKNIFGTHLGLKFEVDSSVLGGLVYKTNSKLLDLSILSKLSQIKEAVQEL